MLSIGPPLETCLGDEVMASFRASGVTTGSEIITGPTTDVHSFDREETVSDIDSKLAGHDPGESAPAPMHADVGSERAVY